MEFIVRLDREEYSPVFKRTFEPGEIVTLPRDQVFYEREVQVLDANGRPERDDDGNPVTETVEERVEWLEPREASSSSTASEGGDDTQP